MSFSVPRWRSPIWGSTRSTISPSSSSTRRSTPCAAGCCGPKLIVKLRIAGAFMGSSSLLRLLIARDDVVRPFPRRQKIEIAEFLREAHRLVHDALEFIVPAHLDKAGQREVLAQRMAVEAVIGQEPAHVGVTGKHHAVKVPCLALEPVGAGKHRDDRGN